MIHENAWSKEISSVFDLGNPDVESIKLHLHPLQERCEA